MKPSRINRRRFVQSRGLLYTLSIVAALLASGTRAQDLVAVGEESFARRCSMCHGADGNGAALGPAIAGRIGALSDEQLGTTITQGLPTRGMPPHNVTPEELAQLITFLRTIRPRQAGFEPYQFTAKLRGGMTLTGKVVGEGAEDVQMVGDDKRLHLLRRSGDTFREVTSQTDWTTYNGTIGGNRYTTLAQITKANVKRVAPRWVFAMPNVTRLEVTPVVVNGVMYVTSGNECYALDAGTGREIWHFQRARTRGLIGNAASGINRGVAVSDDKVFMATDNAHLIALDRTTGKLLWETELADWRKNYNATSSPLLVGNVVIAGTAGGEEGVRGFVAGHDQATGKEIWRFWTVPAPGEPGSETWQGTGIHNGAATAWFTGTYDASTDTVFWPTGNPGNDYNGDERGGDNLYSDCVLALDPKTGRLKWHYQFTPHDVWDWDATETPMVVDANWQGKPRKLLLQGNRNGFFYVFDRTDGKLLLAKQFIRELTWASGIGADGRPILTKHIAQEPNAEGARVCPSQAGATNWYSPSYNPVTGLFYMQTAERCTIYVKRYNEFAYGKSFLGGTPRTAPTPKQQKILRALDIQTGAVKWELPQVGSSTSFGGTLATSTGLVFYADDSGSFAAADATTGAKLWQFDLGVTWRSSPMTYQFDGKQLIGVAAGGNIIAFGVVE